MGGEKPVTCHQSSKNVHFLFDYNSYNNFENFIHLQQQQNSDVEIMSQQHNRSLICLKQTKNFPKKRYALHDTHNDSK